MDVVGLGQLASDGDFRVWKHYTGPLIAIHNDYQGPSLIGAPAVPGQVKDQTQSRIYG